MMWGESWGSMIWGGLHLVPLMSPVGWAFLVGALMGAAIAWQRKALSRGKLTVALLAVAILPLAAVAQVTLPHTFVNGQIADAIEVNANFGALESEANDQDARIAAVEHVGAIYRWAVWSTYEQSSSWYAGNNADMFGGVNPSSWGDNRAVASSMSSDKEVLRTLFSRKGYGGLNAVIAAQQWESYSSTNSRHAAALFRIRNTTGSTINWNVDTYQTAYNGWGERGSVALNGSLITTSGFDTWTASVVRSHVLPMPPNQTSTAIFVAGSGAPSASSRGCYLAFTNDTLALPPGLEYVDDLDVATGGWDQ